MSIIPSPEVHAGCLTTEVAVNLATKKPAVPKMPVAPKKPTADQNMREVEAPALPPKKPPVPRRTLVDSNMSKAGGKTLGVRTRGIFKK
ncbi:hypothetical protein FRX31_033481 [Thalictrum thalictroides]|uniref:Uncharacterized protein n=1 Tax=Thalictrum thalictroides TaxID=46969 RepID=A0A7J6UWQ6_THATH|nr:hypothetical protein FRX31_033481 [Thalictrum thalictroides]